MSIDSLRQYAMLDGEQLETLWRAYDIQTQAANDSRDSARHFFEQLRELQNRLDEAPRAISDTADFEAMTWTFQIRPDCRTGGGTYALVWMPNAKTVGPDAALSRQVPHE